MKTIETEISGFTPVIDAVVQDIGIIAAAVYGVVWRYCQMKDRICRASVDTIAKRIGVSGRTVTRHLVTLVEKGYLEDTTPELHNRPHIYKDTGKAQITSKIEASTMTESHSHYDKLSERTMTESQEKILIEDTIQDTFLSNDASEKKPNGNACFVALAKVCKIDLSLATDTQKRQLGQSSKMLKKSDVTPDHIERFGKYWYAQDWRGKKGQAPTPAQVRAEWGKFKDTGYFEEAVVGW